MVEKWADTMKVKPFGSSGHIILPKKLVDREVRVELVEDEQE